MSVKFVESASPDQLLSINIRMLIWVRKKHLLDIISEKRFSEWEQLKGLAKTHQLDSLRIQIFR